MSKIAGLVPVASPDQAFVLARVCVLPLTVAVMVVPVAPPTKLVPDLALVGSVRNHWHGAGGLERPQIARTAHAKLFPCWYLSMCLLPPPHDASAVAAEQR